MNIKTCLSVCLPLCAFLICTLSSCSVAGRTDGAAVVPAKNIADLFPTASITEKGYYRFDYHDFSVNSESFPDPIVYFDKAHKPIDPLSEIHVGMTKTEAVAILGDPYQDGEGNDDTMAFKCRNRTILVSYDNAKKITKIDNIK